MSCAEPLSVPSTTPKVPPLTTPKALPVTSPVKPAPNAKQPIKNDRSVFFDVMIITFDDTGDILDFEDAMFQELQDGWITQAEFDAVQNYVLGYSLVLDSLDCISNFCI
jgi:hypothetical protein